MPVSRRPSTAPEVILVLVETPASSMFTGAAQPRLDPISPTRRVDFDAPILFGTIGGRPIALARPDQRRAAADEPFDLTVPLTMSRLRRAVDIERDMDAAPYVPSPLFGVPPMYSLSGYYNPSLTASAPGIPQEERVSLLAAAKAALPGCYSEKLNSCVRDKAGVPVVENCAAILEGYAADWDGMEAAVDALPYCEAPKLSVPLMVGGALAAFTLGVGLGLLVSRG